MLKVSITASHIKNAKHYPNSSPIALALKEMGFADACATKRYAYCNTKVYLLPDKAIASETRFDFLAKGGALQGEITEEIKPYDCELEELVHECDDIRVLMSTEIQVKTKGWGDLDE